MSHPEQEQQKLYDDLIKPLENEQIEDFRELFLDIHPYDQAQFFLTVESEVRLRVYTYLSPTEMAEIFENFEIEEQETFISEMEPRYAAQMLAEMYADDAVDVLNELEAEQIASYLTIMDDDAAKEIKELLHYEEKTAGSIMTTEFVAIRAHQTVKRAMQILRQEAPDAETIYYIFVVDHQKRLAGVISLRDIIIADEDTVIEEIMNERVVSVSVGEDQENAARIMKDYDLLALPVVDFQNHLLGIITVDDIVDVIDEEASEDYSRLAGISDDRTSDRGPFSAARKRLPWLIILLFLGMMTASLIGRFEDTLDKVAILAVFIPLIAGMAGNTGTQALAVVVRGIATGDYNDSKKMNLVAREAGTGLIIGLVCGVVVCLVVYLWQGSIFLGMLVGFSLLCTLIVATLAGALVPLFMHKLNIDPAVASGPFITTINDMISILIYFGMATVFMSYLL
ncbi:magnesium transporter [Pseudalkalibacillus caeni]|uniref:Magnesium transporter MgtE n=1 Tax=Exobacillus caeni TaxID=2574798 RepID=A0A5R9F5M5_9BACL|nr:magnesium transporter [Pseudalkalibacillus caeni]TLS37789.1 magnesium transporter [Pseudalkalibacillus caeni]